MRPVFLFSTLAAFLLSGAAAFGQGAPVFNRIATFSVVSNLPAGADPAMKTVAEIVAASADGRMLAYANAERKAVGFIDIADPAAPKSAGEVDLGGEVTSVAIVGNKALIAVVTGESKKAPAGHLATVDLASRRVEARCDFGGQPDSVAKSPDGRFLAVAVENERDENLDKGKIPQLPAGDLKVFTLAGGVPDYGSMKSVALTGLAGVAPEDPEPEFVDVNAAGEAVITLQDDRQHPADRLYPVHLVIRSSSALLRLRSSECDSLANVPSSGAVPLNTSSPIQNASCRHQTNSEGIFVRRLGGHHRVVRRPIRRQ
jgi:hypothetical protein